MILRKKNCRKKIREGKKNCVREASSSGPGCFWIESPYPTGYRVSLVRISESGSEKSLCPRNLKCKFY